MRWEEEVTGDVEDDVDVLVVVVVVLLVGRRKDETGEAVLTMANNAATRD